MTAIKNAIRRAWAGWDGFLFSPTDPATLCLIRVLAGSMLLYTHAVWTLGLSDFFHPTEAWTSELLPVTHDGRYYFTPFRYVEASWVRWLLHAAALTGFACLTVGLFSRVAAVLSFVAAVSYASHATPGAFFGLDRINCLLACYLMLGPCGARYSLDRLWRERRGRGGDPAPSVGANLAVRMIQCHLCVVYLFGGLGKVQGDLWWDGSATWFAVASYEYRSLDMTWLARIIDLGFVRFDLLRIVDFLTHATVFLELFYCCLVWNRWLRPWVVLAAIGMHVFIAAAMGMMTFGLVMIYANLAFVSPSVVRRLIDPLASRVRLAVVGNPSG